MRYRKRLRWTCLLSKEGPVWQTEPGASTSRRTVLVPRLLNAAPSDDPEFMIVARDMAMEHSVRHNADRSSDLVSRPEGERGVAWRSA